MYFLQRFHRGFSAQVGLPVPSFLPCPHADFNRFLSAWQVYAAAIFGGILKNLTDFCEFGVQILY